MKSFWYVRAWKRGVILSAIGILQLDYPQSVQGKYTAASFILHWVKNLIHRKIKKIFFEITYEGYCIFVPWMNATSHENS